MLRKHKNAFMQRILASGMDPALFDSLEHEEDAWHPALRIILKESELYFDARNPRGRFDAFDYMHTESGAGFPLTDKTPEEGYMPFEFVLEGFDVWLANDVADYLQDLSQPDLWSQAASSDTLLARTNAGETENFSPEEKAQIKTGLLQFRLLIEKTFSPSPQEMAAVGAQLEYLAAAVDRLNRFDWKGTALNTVISITVTLSLDTERGRQLFGLFQQAFAHVLHLLK